MNNSNRPNELTRQDWFWIVFVAIVASIATFGGFVIFLPAYIAALLVGYLAVKQFPLVFDRSKRTIFVLKVLAVVFSAFALLFIVELWLLPSVYKG
ncbi:MAG: hypothetical protein ACHP7O_13350 [Burkholderiales bacterium]